MKLILGSQSPRRKDILDGFNIEYEQIPSYFDEDSLPYEGDPVQYVCALSEGKANDLAEKYPKTAILTADTIVFRNEKVYGKPKDEDEAFEMLTELMGMWHSVFTGVTVRFEGEVFSEAEESRVLFNSVTAHHLKQYIRVMGSTNKAGGYAIQGGGGLIVDRIEGCYYNVVGLPINTANRLLERIGISLWDHIG